MTRRWPTDHREVRDGRAEKGDVRAGKAVEHRRIAPHRNRSARAARARLESETTQQSLSGTDHRRDLQRYACDGSAAVRPRLSGSGVTDDRSDHQSEDPEKGASQQGLFAGVEGKKIPWRVVAVSEAERGPRPRAYTEAEEKTLGPSWIAARAGHARLHGRPRLPAHARRSAFRPPASPRRLTADDLESGHWRGWELGACDPARRSALPGRGASRVAAVTIRAP